MLGYNRIHLTCYDTYNLLRFYVNRTKYRLALAVASSKSRTQSFDTEAQAHNKNENRNTECHRDFRYGRFHFMALGSVTGTASFSHHWYRFAHIINCIDIGVCAGNIKFVFFTQTAKLLVLVVRLGILVS